jgi:hypothetical protein
VRLDAFARLGRIGSVLAKTQGCTIGRNILQEQSWSRLQ